MPGSLSGAPAPGVNHPRCLVTGGAGFLGINLVRLLLRRGWAVRVLDIVPFEYPEVDRVNVVLGDIRDEQLVDHAMNGVDVVVHCAAALPLADEAEIRSTGIKGTRVTLEAARRHGVNRFVFVSSTAVYGLPKDHPIVESEALVGVGPYGEAKIGAEQACEAARARGLCVTILRPKSFIGPERLGVFELLYDWAADGHGFPVLGDGANMYQLLDVDDLCEVILLSMVVAPAIANDTFNVGAERFCTMRQNVQSVLDRAGHGKRATDIPAGLAVALLRLLGALKLSPLYPWIYESAGHNSVVSIERLKARTGFAPRYSNVDALLRNYDWYLAHRPEYRGRQGVTHRVPWKRGALRLAKAFF